MMLPDQRVDSVTSDDIAKIIEAWNLKPSTAAKQLERIRSFFRFCLERGWIERNPAAALKPPKEHVIAVKPFTADELEKIFWAPPFSQRRGSIKKKTERVSRRS